MSRKPKKNSLRMADGGEAVTRWAGHQLRMADGGVQGLMGGDRLAQQNAATAASSIVKDASQQAGAAALGAGRPQFPAVPYNALPAAGVKAFATPPAVPGVSPMVANPTDQRRAAGTQTSPGMSPGTGAGDIQFDSATRTLSNAAGRASATLASPLTMGSAQNQGARDSLLARTPGFTDFTKRPQDGLFMRDGGEAPPTSLRGIYNRLTSPAPAPAPVASAPAPAPVASAPQTGIRGYVANGALARREAAAGLQDGGQVPGSGHGDKIPAKYEPGEFVVSNDMIDDNPGLRETLHSLRAETLAARGKTVAEADAGAVKHGPLKAMDGVYFDDMGEPLGQKGPAPGSYPGAMRGKPLVFEGAPLNPTPAAPKTLSMIASDAFNAKPGKLALAGRAGGLTLSAYPEAVKTYEVAKAPGSTFTDAAVQGYEGVGKLATAGIGAATGAAAGAMLAPVTGGLSVPIGGILGGAYGYFAGDQGIKGLRKLTGQDTRSPHERLVAEPAKAAAAAAQPAPVAVPAQPVAAAPVVAAPVVPPTPAPTMRSGFDGFTAPAQAQEDAPIAVAPSIRHSGNDWEARNNLRNLAVSASSISQKRPRGGVSTAEAAYLDAQKHDTNLKGGNTLAEVAGIKAASEANTSRNSMRSYRDTADKQLLGTLATAGARSRDSAANAQREQIESDRKYALDVAKFGTDVADKNRSNKIASEKAFSDRITSMVGNDKDGTIAARVRNGANAHLDKAMAEADALLAKEPNNASALARKKAIAEQGLGLLSEDDIRAMVIGQKANAVATEYDGWMPWKGSAKNTDTPVTSMRKGNSLLFKEYVTNNGQTIPARALDANPDLQRLVR